MAEKIKLKVFGNPQYTLNLLAKHSVTVLRPKPQEEHITFLIYSRDGEKVKKLLRDYGRKFEISAVLGGAVNLKALSKRYGFWGGVLIGAFIVAVYSTMLVGVSISGAERVDEEAVKELIYNEVKLPSFLSPVDLASLENSIVGLDGVAYASVKRKGRVLSVEIIEELPKVDITDTQKLEPLRASEGGVITKIVVYGGEAAVSVGDEVAAGQELIMPYLKSAEGALRPTLALGKVEARVTRSEELSYPSEEEFNARYARDMEDRLNAFKQTLGEGEQFLGSRFLVKNVDKSIVCSIYYEIITRIA